uniref:OmpA-like domain-containing protein n=1 Tax=Chromera velia CCMP2878 TaxID=1169474 RepID=A0A0G4HIP6_9ALVE|eukprot:Cvel_6990.t1-p1 / transcript=Cvel_6990.t1 / gene=Cvel_6990 / organism=Chromera_velia_CCMP2878 / gene_product=hypothetical protein / transcript_product=hypothetical protein / location=Cvel_scaffold355:73359-75035(+) / protein_length=559 / sequence_SO=supercontig / SO=protein_coding / is_pseudo=false
MTSVSNSPALQKLEEYPFMQVLCFLPVRDICFLLKTDTEIRTRIPQRSIAKWILTESRVKSLQSKQKTGDLPFTAKKKKEQKEETEERQAAAPAAAAAAPAAAAAAPAAAAAAAAAKEEDDTDEISLEKLHLLENPPRFPTVFFEFGGTVLSPNNAEKLKSVSDLLKRHPKLRIRVEGRCQPDAPRSIHRRLSLGRARAAANVIGASLSQEDYQRQLEVVGMGAEPVVNENLRLPSAHRVSMRFLAPFFFVVDREEEVNGDEENVGPVPHSVLHSDSDSDDEEQEGGAGAHDDGDGQAEGRAGSDSNEEGERDVLPELTESPDGQADDEEGEVSGGGGGAEEEDGAGGGGEEVRTTAEESPLPRRILPSLNFSNRHTSLRTSEPTGEGSERPAGVLTQSETPTRVSLSLSLSALEGGEGREDEEEEAERQERNENESERADGGEEDNRQGEVEGSSENSSPSSSSSSGVYDNPPRFLARLRRANPPPPPRVPPAQPEGDGDRDGPNPAGSARSDTPRSVASVPSDRPSDTYSEWGAQWRRVDITLLGLVGEDENQCDSD